MVEQLLGVRWGPAGTVLGDLQWQLWKPATGPSICAGISTLGNLDFAVLGVL